MTRFSWKSLSSGPSLSVNHWQKGRRLIDQELEKLISYSATPTAVWRRTGEVCYANPEFCKLVEKDGELFSGKTYIYQLLARTR